MMGEFDYYQINNIINSIKVPGAVNLYTNTAARYFARYLVEKAISVFKWNLPKTWDKDYFLYVLYIMGYIGVLDTEQFGVIPQWGTLTGYNVYYAPRQMQFSNPLIGTKILTIHDECEIIKLQGNYNGIYDMILYYAGKMALMTEAVDVNLLNTKLSKVFFTKNKNAAESIKKMIDEVQEGNPAVVLDQSLLTDEGKFAWEWFNDNLSQNYIVSDLLIDLRKIENEFCTDLGIPNTNTDKRERLTTDEVNANNAETQTRAELWLERLQECVAKVNTMFNLDISVDWRIKPNERDTESVGTVSSGRNDT